MKFRIFLFLIFISSLTSCSINGSFQGLFSYYKKTKKEGKINFLKFDTNNDYLNSYSDSTTIVLSNGKEIKKYLKNFEKSITSLIKNSDVFLFLSPEAEIFLKNYIILFYL